MNSVEIAKLYSAAFCDPSGGNARGHGHSRSAITVVGSDEVGNIFILACWAAHCGTDRLIEKIFEIWHKWKPAVFGMDISGPQKPFFDMVRKEAMRRGVQIPFRGVALLGKKVFTIEHVLQPLSARGQLFRPHHKEVSVLADEWRAFPTGFYRDALDTLANAVKLLPSKLPAESRAMSREQFRRYLERTGMPEDQIRTRLAQHGG